MKYKWLIGKNQTKWGREEDKLKDKISTDLKKTRNKQRYAEKDWC